MIVMANNVALSTDWPESKDIHSITKAKCITQPIWCTGYDTCSTGGSETCNGYLWSYMKRTNQRDWGVCEGTLAVWSCTDYADFYCAELSFYDQYDPSCEDRGCWTWVIVGPACNPATGGQ
jgi:hypothetical protein